MTTTATIVGNLSRDPEIRYTAAGKPVVSFGVAVGRRKKTDTGWEDDGADFYDVTCWDSLAENVAESLEKGNRVVVTGRLRQETWEKEGEKRSKVSVTADEVGPSLRWATVEVARTERRSVDEAKKNVAAAFDESPF